MWNTTKSFFYLSTCPFSLDVQNESKPQLTSRWQSKTHKNIAETQLISDQYHRYRDGRGGGSAKKAEKASQKACLCISGSSSTRAAGWPRQVHKDFNQWEGDAHSCRWPAVCLSTRWVGGGRILFICWLAYALLAWASVVCRNQNFRSLVVFQY